MSAITAPLLEWQREQQETARTRIVSELSDQETVKARIKELRGKAARNEDIEDFEKAKKEIQALEQSIKDIPATPRLWAEDVTPEKLGQLMAEQGECLSLLSDEGGLFEIMAGRYSSGIPNIDIFLKAHAGSPVCVDRGSRQSVMMQRPALTIGLSPQPEVLRGLAEKPGFRGRGLLARFLYVLPDSRLGRRGLDPKPVPETITIRYRAALYALLELKPQIEADGYKPHTLHLADDAYRAWKAFQKAVEPELLDGGQFENLKDWAGKLPGAAIRLAGLLHCAEHAHRSPADVHISLSTMTQALDLAHVIAEHALVAFDLIGSNPVMDAARKLWRWIERTQTKEPSARDCFQALKGTYRRMADLEPAFDVLVERFYLFEAPRAEEKLAPGRPSRRFSVNPILVERWS